MNFKNLITKLNHEAIDTLVSVLPRDTLIALDRIIGSDAWDNDVNDESDASELLLCGFTWADTHEGHKFWSHAYDEVWDYVATKRWLNNPINTTNDTNPEV